MDKIRCLFTLILLLSLGSCSQLYDFMYGEAEKVTILRENEELNAPSQVENSERSWTILVYMSGDNDLESAALEDLCEMEYSKLNTDEVTVLMLVDRNPAYDTTYDNWSGTRLYRLETGRSSSSKSLISTEIECKDLGLSVGTETELDMSSTYVLENSFLYARKKYPAQYYGLIIWGHGTGWRGDASEAGKNEAAYKGFAHDSTSGTYMTLYQLGTAIKNIASDWKISFLGFDTCYGGELEVMYELKDYVKFCAGSEGLIGINGWNYESLWNLFEGCKSKKPEDLCSCVLTQFKNQYEYKSGASIVCVNMEKLKEFFLAADELWKGCGELVTSLNIRDELMSVLYSGKNCEVKKYTYGTAGSDVYLDVASMLLQMKSYFETGNADEDEKRKLLESYESFCHAKENCFLESWSSENGEGGLGVYFSTLNDSVNLSAVHPAAFFKGRTAEQIAFVEESLGYVPCNSTGSSLLDKLFYTEF